MYAVKNPRKFECGVRISSKSQEHILKVVPVLSSHRMLSKFSNNLVVVLFVGVGFLSCKIGQTFIRYVL